MESPTLAKEVSQLFNYLISIKQNKSSVSTFGYLYKLFFEKLNEEFYNSIL